MWDAELPAIWIGRWRHQSLHPAIGSMQIRARSSSCDILIQVGPEEFTFIVSMLWLIPKSWIPQWHWCLRWSLLLPSASVQPTLSRISVGLFNKHIKKSTVAGAIQERSMCKGTALLFSLDLYGRFLSKSKVIHLNITWMQRPPQGHSWKTFPGLENTSFLELTLPLSLCTFYNIHLWEETKLPPVEVWVWKVHGILSVTANLGCQLHHI